MVQAPIHWTNRKFILCCSTFPKLLRFLIICIWNPNVPTSTHGWVLGEVMFLPRGSQVPHIHRTTACTHPQLSPTLWCPTRFSAHGCTASSPLWSPDYHFLASWRPFSNYCPHHCRSASDLSCPFLPPECGWLPHWGPVLSELCGPLVVPLWTPHFLNGCFKSCFVSAIH